MPTISRVDPRTPAAQIADSLRADINAGRLAIGDRLPSERELAINWGVSTTTIARAIAQLRNEGLIDSRPGAARYIRRQPARQRLDRLTTAPANIDFQIRVEQPDPGAAGALTAAEDSDILVREAVVYDEHQPVQLVMTRLAPTLAPGTELERPGPSSRHAHVVLAELGHPVDRLGDTIHTRMPTPAERSTLQLGPGEPVLIVTRTGYGRDNRPLIVHTVTLAGSRYLLYYDVPAEQTNG